MRYLALMTVLVACANHPSTGEPPRSAREFHVPAICRDAVYPALDKHFWELRAVFEPPGDSGRLLLNVTCDVGDKSCDGQLLSVDDFFNNAYGEATVRPWMGNMRSYKEDGETVLLTGVAGPLVNVRAAAGRVTYSTEGDGAWSATTVCDRTPQAK